MTMDNIEDLSSSLLTIQNLKVRYGTKIVLNDLSLKVNDNEIVVVTGKNGSGKSTLLNTIGRNIHHYEGEIFLNGFNLINSMPHELHKHGIVYIPQGGLIVNSLNVMQHFKLASRYLDKITASKRIEDAYSTFPAVKAFSNKLAANLSGGEKQMLSFASASIIGGKLWLLDEPTAGLSRERIVFLTEYIKMKNEVDNVSFLIVEHNELFFNDLSAKIVELVEGTAVTIKEA